jgi:hypothetical protein
VLSLAVSLLSVHVYFSSEAAANPVMEESMAWTIVGGLSGSWLAVYLVFLSLIHEEYRYTFYSTQTIREWVLSTFLDEDEDGTMVDVKKMRIHGYVSGGALHNNTQHEALTRALRLFNSQRRAIWMKEIGEDVKEWTLGNWSRWEEEKPDWFTDEIKATVDDSMIPAKALASLNRRAGGERRRSTLGDSVAGVGGRAANGRAASLGGRAASLGDSGAGLGKSPKGHGRWGRGVVLPVESEGVVG